MLSHSVALRCPLEWRHGTRERERKRALREREGGPGAGVRMP